MTKTGRPERKEFFIIQTEGSCTDATLGHHWQNYASDRIAPDDKEKFELHVLECLYCAALVKNFRETKAASEYYGVPIGPELDKLMTVVRFGEPAAGFVKATAGLMHHFGSPKPRPH